MWRHNTNKTVSHLFPGEVRRLITGDRDSTDDGKEMSKQATPLIKTT